MLFLGILTGILVGQFFLAIAIRRTPILLDGAPLGRHVWEAVGRDAPEHPGRHFLGGLGRDAPATPGRHVWGSSKRDAPHPPKRHVWECVGSGRLSTFIFNHLVF